MPLTLETINRGTVANDGTGDTLYVAAGKINDNFTDINNALDTKAGYGAVGTWTKAQVTTPVTLTSSGGAVALDLSLSNEFYHLLTENTTLSLPTNIAVGQAFNITIEQHASAAKTLDFNAVFKVGSGVTVDSTLSSITVLACHVSKTGHIKVRAVKETGGGGTAGVGVPTGGTAGQILAKTSAVDYETDWIDNYATQTKHDVSLALSIAKGQAVYASSANGTNIVVSKASNDTEAASSKTMGLLETGGVTNDVVKVVTSGLIAGLDTSTATNGDPVWLGTSGNLLFGLANKPVAPAHLVYIGVVTRSHATNGEIFVHVQNGFELSEIHDVSIVGRANGYVLTYNSTSGLYEFVNPNNGGWLTLGSCTYESADSPTFQFSIASDATGIIGVGFRIKLTQTTVKYFIVTAVGAYSGGKTIVTVYGGTDYTLANAAITSPYYSNVKAPFGFPITEDKWTVTFTDTTIRSQASPANGTWYNLGGASISEPIGAWKGKVSCLIGSVRASAGGVSSYATISTANNTESDVTKTFGLAFDTGLTSAYCNFDKSFDISTAVKTPLYFNSKTNSAGIATLYNFNANSMLTIKLTSAYL